MSETVLRPEDYRASRPEDVHHATLLDKRFKEQIRKDEGVRSLVSENQDAVAEALPLVLREPHSTESGKCTKIVHIVRHGNGVHNVMVDSWNEIKKLGGSRHIDAQALFGLDESRQNPAGPSYTPLIDALRDAPLTELGRQEASATRKQAEASGATPTLLVVSTMRRAAETGLMIFPEGARVVAHDALHESSGLYSWDRRRDLKEIQGDLSLTRVDWSLVTSETCPWWIEDRRETDVEMTQRLVGFMRWLRAQPEKEVAIASHSHIIHVLLQCGLLVIPDGAMTVNGMVADSWFITGEMRSFVLKWRDGKRKRDESS